MPPILPCRIALVIALGLLVGGCGKGDKPKPPGPRTKTGRVSGKVSIKGKRLGGGSIKFYPADGSEETICPIYPDGKYETDDLPIGEAIVTIETKTALDLMPGGAASSKPPYSSKLTYVEIPKHYADKKKSGLTYNVKPGKQEKDFDLEGK
jgi:hypothetical protein